MDKLKNVKAERSQLRRAFTKISNEIDKSITDESRPSSDEVLIIKANVNKIQDKADRLFQLDEAIKGMLFSTENITEQELENEFETVESYRDVLSTVKAKYEHFISLFEAQTRSERGESSNSSDQISLASKKCFNLPKLQLNQFDGNVKGWIGFWGQYRKVHEDTHIENEDKFQYLLQSLKPGSSARELVESFPPSGENYEKALEQLKSRFGRDEFLIEVYVRELLGLVLQKAIQGTNTTLCKLYDKLETQLRALETLGVTSDKYASMLYPLVESALPEDTLRAWERQRSSNRLVTDKSSSLTGNYQTNNYLQELLDFLKVEVQSEERLALARSSFKSDSRGTKDNYFQRKAKAVVGQQESRLPTAATILTTGDSSEIVSKCIYCTKGRHNTQDCSSFQKLSLAERREHVTKKGCCFACLKPGHTVKGCKVFVKCIFCCKKHYGIMCRDLDAKKMETPTPKSEAESQPQTKSEVLSNFETCSQETLLQTLLVNVQDENGKTYLARILLDTGSQRSYVTKDCVKKLGLQEMGNEHIEHSLFGGVNVQTSHKMYLITLGNVNNDFKYSVPVLDQDVICKYVPRLTGTKCLEALREKNIVLTDVGNSAPDVKILLGSDVLGDLYTGLIEKLHNGLVAVETHLGWTIMGKQYSSNGKHNTLVSLFSQGRPDISDLWSLESIGIRDSAEMKTRTHMEAEATRHLRKPLRSMNIKDMKFSSHGSKAIRNCSAIMKLQKRDFCLQPESY